MKKLIKLRIIKSLKTQIIKFKEIWIIKMIVNKINYLSNNKQF
jgi:hypothetical protein